MFSFSFIAYCDDMQCVINKCIILIVYYLFIIFVSNNFKTNLLK